MLTKHVVLQTLPPIPELRYESDIMSTNTQAFQNHLLQCLSRIEMK